VHKPESLLLNQEVAALVATPLHDLADQSVDYEIVSAAASLVAGGQDVDASGQFAVGRSSGSVTLLSAMDREVVTKFTVMVRATDHGEPRKSSTAVLTVVIDDVNDNAPTFNPSAETVSLREETAAGMLVYTASAPDIDQGDNARVHFSILAGNEEGVFSIDTTSGDITAAKDLSSTSLDRYDITVKASDLGVPALTDELALQLLVVRFGAPLFGASQYDAEIREDAQVNATLVQVRSCLCVCVYVFVCMRVCVCSCEQARTFARITASICM